MKKILWITGDYFIDVDFLIVPYIKSHYDYDIKWVVLKSINSGIYIDPTLPCDIVEIRHKSKDPRIAFEFSRIFKKMNKSNADLIYSNFVGMPYYFPILRCYFKGVPIVHAAHNVIPYKGWPNKRMTSCYIKYIFRINNYFHLFSKFTADYFIRHYSNKSLMCCPMPLKSYGVVGTNNYNVDSSKINLLFFGNVKANKRLDLLIKAMNLLPNDIQKKLHLNICGKCDNKDKYLQMIGDNHNIKTYFHRIADEDIPELFTKHDYLVLPYQDVAQSGPQMIAYNYNLPVIASDIEGFKERIEDGKTGYLFVSGDCNSLKDILNKVALLNNAEYIKMKKSLEEYVDKNYSLDKLASRYTAYFSTIIG